MARGEADRGVGQGMTAQGSRALGLFTPRGPSKVVGHEVWPAVS